jgi:SAM-dependent methyltransferase
MCDQPGFWYEYYRKLAEAPVPWLDYSNERVQAQSLALALEAAGAVLGRKCLDVGCGNGQLCRILSNSGARSVTGVDFIDSVIAENRRRFPEVQWRVASAEAEVGEGNVDLVFMVEVLQYIEIEASIRRYWDALTAGGRVVGIVPNADCPIVQRVIERFDAQYRPPSQETLRGVLDRVAGNSSWKLRGMSFQNDQTICPYRVSGWGNRADEESVPNRLQFVAIKS